MGRLSLTIATLIVTLSTVSSGSQTPEAGSVIGHVRLIARSGAALPSTAYTTRAVGVHDAQSAPDPIKNVVVYLKDVAYRGALPATRAELRQEHEMFLPHVI